MLLFLLCNNLYLSCSSWQSFRLKLKLVWLRGKWKEFWDTPERHGWFSVMPGSSSGLDSSKRLTLNLYWKQLKLTGSHITMGVSYVPSNLLGSRNISINNILHTKKTSAYEMALYVDLWCKILPWYYHSYTHKVTWAHGCILKPFLDSERSLIILKERGITKPAIYVTSNVRCPITDNLGLNICATQIKFLSVCLFCNSSKAGMDVCLIKQEYYMHK